MSKLQPWPGAEAHTSSPSCSGRARSNRGNEAVFGPFSSTAAFTALYTLQPHSSTLCAHGVDPSFPTRLRCWAPAARLSPPECLCHVLNLTCLRILRSGSTKYGVLKKDRTYAVLAPQPLDLDPCPLRASLERKCCLLRAAGVTHFFTDFLAIWSSSFQNYLLSYSMG